MKPANVLRLYRVRLRARFVQECFALVGITAGVALLLASEVSSTSLQSSVAQLSRGIAGNATLQLIARGPDGLPESALGRVRRIPGVRVAAPVLEVASDISGPRGAQPVELIGADKSLSSLDGQLVRRAALAPFRGIGAVVLPAPLARAIGVTRFGQEASFQLAGRTAELPLYSELSKRQVGALVAAPIALAPLFSVQELAGLPARVSRILVQPARGRQAAVRRALEAVAGNRFNVVTIGYDETLFAEAAATSNQSTRLFAAISALVGFLFAFNAMLFTVPQRRRLIVDLRRDGYSPKTVLGVLLVDAVILGSVASALGLVLGNELSIYVLHSNPAFLSLAFTIGSSRAVSLQALAIAAGGGMLAALVAVFVPLRHTLSRHPSAPAKIGRAHV